ncbi:hypothetical protein [Rhizobium terrae]|uniref:hypothetical protein n=1 Tax=Rhizobium terrae TaxID=2171756 RepID=UPI001D00A5C8|nr:hypothetical protein [Rhizobium terrae]
MTGRPVARMPLIATSTDEERRLASVEWAMSHQPTREAYRLCTGEDVGPTLDRYLAWLEENIIGTTEAIDHS